MSPRTVEYFEEPTESKEVTNKEDARYQNYLFDLGQLIRERALETKKEADEKGTDFDSGRLMTYFEVVSLMQAQATAFEIALEDIRLDGLNPESDLL